MSGSEPDELVAVGVKKLVMGAWKRRRFELGLFLLLRLEGDGRWMEAMVEAGGKS